MGASIIKLAIGKPTVSSGGNSYYLHEHAKMIQELPFAVSSWILIAFQQDRVQSIAAEKLTVN
jgi:hypothetical protein